VATNAETESQKDDEGKIKHVTVHRKDHHHFVKEKIVLSGAVTLQPGQNTFRFTHHLSPGLPASFQYAPIPTARFVSCACMCLCGCTRVCSRVSHASHSEKTSVHTHKVKAKVDYELTAEVDAHHGHDLKSHLHLTLGQRRAGTHVLHVSPALMRSHCVLVLGVCARAGPVSPVEHTNRKSFMFNQGNLGMRVELDRDVYFPGDEVKMKLEVSNESVKKVCLSCHSSSHAPTCPRRPKDSHQTRLCR
jgi:hypothetical protein